MVGQGLGAENPVRAERSGHTAALQCAIFTGTLGVLYFMLANPLYALLTNDPHVRELGVPALRVMCFAQPALAIMIVYTGSLRGAGDTRVPLIFTVIGMFAVRIPAAWLFAVVFDGGLTGAWFGTSLDITIRSLLQNWRFTSGAWRHIRV
jgi:Na+-driven multidrug efflux pump